MKEITSILELLSSGKIPNLVDENSGIDMSLFSTIVDEGFIEAINASDSEGIAFLNPILTIPGIEYLKKNKITIDEKKVVKKNFWNIIETDYNLTKRSFGKKINFIEDKKIRSIIFRDIEQAFFLEKEGLFKPAIILAGGVIEELLRNYLNKMKIKPKKRTLEGYIDSCSENKLLNKAISNMAHYIRSMRNLVHIEKESKDETIIDQALAKSIVSSIITLANCF